MKGFMVKDGDTVITANLLNGKREIEIVSDDELMVQTIQSVLSTNKGEWIFDAEEGINFANILGKQKIKSTSATANSTILQEYEAQQINTNALAERLRKRLDGE